MYWHDSKRSMTFWQHLIARKEQSVHLAQRKSLLMGLDERTGSSFSVPLEVFQKGHAHISGKTNGGKTMASVLPLILQFIRGYRLDNGTWSKKSPVIVLDLKGDKALFHATKLAAEADARRFRFLTDRTDVGYYFFDPFQMIAQNPSSAMHYAAAWVRALGLDYGLVYGGKYFTDQNMVLLTQAFHDMLHSGSRPSLGKLSNYLNKHAAKKQNSDARHIQLCLSMLAEYPQINIDLHRQPPTNVINFGQAIEEGDVLYFHFEIQEVGSPLRQLAALTLATLLAAAKQRLASGKSSQPIYVVVDEFFHIAGKAFGDLLATVREWGVHFILANQTSAQLMEHDKHLPAVVRTNTVLKQFFSAVNEDEIEFLRDASGGKTDFKFGTTFSTTGQSTSVSEGEGWHLGPDEIQRLSDTHLLSAIVFDDGRPRLPGQRVRLVQAQYPLSLLEYQVHHTTPLPNWPNHEGVEQAVKVDEGGSANASEPQRKQTKATPPANPKADELEMKLHELFSQLSSLEAA